MIDERTIAGFDMMLRLLRAERGISHSSRDDRGINAIFFRLNDRYDNSLIRQEEK